MNSLLSLISGQFTRTLILSTFFPVLLFLAFGILTVAPLLPDGLPLTTLRNFDTQWVVFAITGVAVVLTVFLYNLNTAIIRFLEGYNWIESKIGAARKKTWEARCRQIENLIPRLRLLRNAWISIDPTHSNIEKLQRKLNTLGIQLNFEYPSPCNLALPTRFGNVIRSFESYPSRHYGLDANEFWPRIVSVASKESLDVAEEERSSVDFFANCAVLSALLAAVLFVAGCSVTDSETPVGTLIRWPLETLAAVLSAVLFYQGSIGKVTGWGAQVRSIYDLYRWDLLKRLGYQQIASTKPDERALWGSVSKQFIYGDPPTGSPLPYVEEKESTCIKTEPADVQLEVTAGVGEWLFGNRRYVYRVVNKDLLGRTAEQITWIETPPEGMAYVWDSAKKNGGQVEVTGKNPYSVSLGPLRANESVEFSYVAMKNTE
jgi:hypothetical protein